MTVSLHIEVAWWNASHYIWEVVTVTDCSNIVNIIKNVESILYFVANIWT